MGMQHITKIERIINPDTGYDYGDLVVRLDIDGKGRFTFDTQFISSGMEYTPDALRKKADEVIQKRFDWN